MFPLQPRILRFGDKFGSNGKLGGRQGKRLLSHRRLYAMHLIKDSSGFDNRDVVVNGALSLTHPNFQGFFGDWFIGENLDPNLSTPFYMTGHGDTSGLDLAGSDLTCFQCLETIIAEGQGGPTFSLAFNAAFMLLSKFQFLG